MTNTGASFDLLFHSLTEVAADHPGVSVDEGMALAMRRSAPEPVSDARVGAVARLLLEAGPEGLDLSRVSDRDALRVLVAMGATRSVGATGIRLRRAFVAVVRSRIGR